MTDKASAPPSDAILTVPNLLTFFRLCLIPVFLYAAIGLDNMGFAVVIAALGFITDLVDVHASWACADVDAVVVPSPGGLERCRRAGIPASRCHAFGLPVDARFSEPPPAVSAFQ